MINIIDFFIKKVKKSKFLFVHSINSMSTAFLLLLYFPI